MKLTKEWLKEHDACESGYKYALKNLLGLSEKETIKKLMEDGQFNWANWFIVRVMEEKQYLSYAIFAAEQVLDIYEKEYTEDKRPRLAIEAAKKYLSEPTKENKDVAHAAADAAYAADAAAHAAAHAADAADAAYAAAYAAYAADAADAAYAAAYAADAADAAAYAAADAADAAYAADAAAKEGMQIKILNYGLTLLEGK